MKFLDPQSVTVRRDRMLRSTAALFVPHLGEFRRFDEHYYFRETEHDEIKLGFDAGGKLLSKAFGLYASLLIHNVDMEHDWTVRARFSGNTKIQNMIFKADSRDNAPFADYFNTNTALMQELTALASSFDIKDILISYSKSQKHICCKIIPFAGAFIWVKFPPIYYDVKLKEFEAEKISALLSVFQRFFAEKRAA